MPENTSVSVLLIDDDPLFQSSMQRRLTRLGCDVQCAASIAEAKELLLRRPVSLCLVDWSLPDGEGIEIVRWGFARSLVQRAYCITGFATTQNVVSAVRAGCTDVIEKPFDSEKLTNIVKSATSSAIDELSQWRAQKAPYIIGNSPALLEVLRVVSRVSTADCSVLITGESGTGKELIARAIHDSSTRASGPLVAINCAAIPENLIESELFGHVKGAFTGADKARDGHILAANNGTLFLDEIGEMPLLAQAKLLRVLQDARLMQVGSDKAIPVNVRIVAATNKDLEAMVEEKRFRGDLLYRLNVIQTDLPPLRERSVDVPLLAEHFLKYFNAKLGCSVSGLDERAAAALMEHGWPGNIRELSNAVHRAVLLKAGGVLTADDFRLSKNGARHTPHASFPTIAAPLTPAAVPPQPAGANLNLKSAIDDVERQLILMALERSNGNRTEAAALLGLNRTTLVEKLRKLGS